VTDGAGVKWIDRGRKSSQFDGQMAMFRVKLLKTCRLAGKDDDDRDGGTYDDMSRAIIYYILCGKVRPI